MRQAETTEDLQAQFEAALGEVEMDLIKEREIAQRATREAALARIEAAEYERLYREAEEALRAAQSEVRKLTKANDELNGECDQKDAEIEELKAENAQIETYTHLTGDE